jgi:hypothetical protein
LKELGTEGRKAGNDLIGLALGAFAVSDGMGSSYVATEEFTQAIEKSLDPLKGAAVGATQLSEAVKAQGIAMALGNEALDKRVLLLQRLIDAQTAVTRLTGTPAEERARSAAGTLEAQVRQTPQDAAEERRHRIALENIRAEAQARRADVAAQLEAAQATALEARRTETQRLVGAGMDPEAAANMAAQSEAVIAANNAVAEATRHLQDEETAATIAGVQDRIAAEAHGSKEKIALQAEIIAIVQREFDAGRATQAQLDAVKRAGTVYAKDANREEYAEAAKNYENQLRSAKGSFEEVTRIIEEWKATAAAAFANSAVDFKRAMEDIERSGILAFKHIVEEALSSASALRAANQDILQGFSHVIDARIKASGSAGVQAAPGLLAQEVGLAEKLSAIDKARLDDAMKLADAHGDQTERTKAYWDLWRLGIHTQTTILGIQEKIAEAVKRAAQEVTAAQVAQLKLSEAIAKSRGDYEEIVRLRIREAEIIRDSIYSTPAQKIGANTDIINALAEEQQRKFAEADKFNTAQERLDKIRIAQNKALLQAQVNDHSMSKEMMAIREAEFTSQRMAEEERRIEEELRDNALTDQQKEKLFNHLAELYERDAELQMQAQQRVSEAIEKENEKRTKALKTMFDEIGSGLEKSITGILTGEPQTNLVQDLRKSLTKAFVGEAFSLGSSYLGKQLAPMLGVKTEGLADTSLGNVLGRAVGNMLGLTKETPQDAMKGVSEKLSRAAEAQQEAAKLFKPSVDTLKEAGKALMEAAEALKKLGGLSPEAKTGAPGTPGTPITPSGEGGDATTKAWQEANLATVSTQGVSVQVNKAVADHMQTILNKLTAEGYPIHSLSGFRAGATVEGTGAPSRHATGMALDINPSENPVGGGRGNLPADMGSIVAAEGGRWGAGFRKTDPMHVDFGPTSAAVTQLGTAAQTAAQSLHNCHSLRRKSHRLQW